MVKRNNYNGERLVNNEFGMKVNEQMALVDARVLPSPMVISAHSCFTAIQAILLFLIK